MADKLTPAQIKKFARWGDPVHQVLPINSALENKNKDAAKPPVEILREPDSIDRKAGKVLRLLPREQFIGTMGPAARIRLAAEILGLTGTELIEAANQYKAAKAEATERETTAGVREPPRLVDTATETIGRTKEPPRPDWIEAHNRGVEVPEFIEKKFAAEIRNRSMHRGLFSRYENLRRDFYAYQRHHELPGWLEAIPTKEDWNTRRLKGVSIEDVRLHEVARKRLTKPAAKRTGARL
jgi:hypothetical protein